MITFTTRDCLDSFEFFIENFEFRRESYNFHTLLGLFMRSIDNEIQDGYSQNEWQDVKSTIKKAIYRHFKDIDFSTYYNKEEIMNIVF